MVVQVAEQLDVQLVVVLGSLIAEVAHTLPVPITGGFNRRADRPQPRARTPRLRRPDRHRRRDPRPLPGRRPALGFALGGGAPLRCSGPQPEGVARAQREARIDHPVAADIISGLEDETMNYEEQIGRAVAADPEVEELVERIEKNSASGAGRSSTSPAAMPLRWSSSGSSRTAIQTDLCRAPGFGGRADQPEVTPAADPGRGARFEVPAEHLRRPRHGPLDPLAVIR